MSWGDYLLLCWIAADLITEWRMQRARDKRFKNIEDQLQALHKSLIHPMSPAERGLYDELMQTKRTGPPSIYDNPPGAK